MSRIFILIAFLLLPFVIFTQTRNLHVTGEGDQLGVIQTTSTGSSIAGLELLRGNEFNSTDWRIINEGGTLKILDETNNFNSPGDLNLILTSAGSLKLPLGSEASIGNDSGVLVIGDDSGPNLALDNNEILVRDGTRGSDLFIQPGLDVGNTYLQIAAGNVGIGDLIAPSRLSVMNGSDVKPTGGGYVLLGYEGGENIGIDNNEIMARDGADPSNLFLQHGGGNVSIGASDAATTYKLTVEDAGFQVKLTNANDNTNNWVIGATGPGWNAGAGKLAFDDDGNSSNPILLLDGPKEAAAIGTSYVPDGFKFAVAGKTICEEVQVELEGEWPDYVFTDSYPLTDLLELEKEIQNLGHLPGVPNADEVKRSGIALGKMQSILLEKIEELTLHVIDLRKANNQLRKELDNLSK